MNTVTLNGVISTEIPGLLIQTLPPISKPLMRTQREEIDGRDGDIITNLGFSAYDKEISIGLYDDFDINEIIAYFTGSGEVTFSNEPDKYYRYQIINQIDYERLIRFKTAKVTFHVQPFKYKVDETPATTTFPQFATETIDAYEMEWTTSGNTVTTDGIIRADSANPWINFNSITNKQVTAGVTYSFEVTTQADGLLPVISARIPGVTEWVSLSSGSTVVTTFTPSNNDELTGVQLQLTRNTALYDFSASFAVLGGTSQTMTVRNEGNTFAKPLITITGSGTINVTLNEQQIFVIDLGETETFISIDIEEMNAYQGNALANRKVTGDYDNFLLIPGNNTVELTGSVTDCTLTRVSRWI